MTQSGTTNITAWQQFGEDAVVVQVSFDEAFDSTPNIVASLNCDTRSQPSTSGIRIMNPSPVGFQAYLQLSDGGALAVSQATGFNWRVSYIASVD